MSSLFRQTIVLIVAIGWIAQLGELAFVVFRWRSKRKF